MPQIAYTPPTPKHIEPAICPKCQTPMGIVRIERLGLGYNMRTFECSNCKREEMAVVKQA
jgi:hypothetical protein